MKLTKSNLTLARNIIIEYIVWLYRDHTISNSMCQGLLACRLREQLDIAPKLDPHSFWRFVRSKDKCGAATRR